MKTLLYSCLVLLSGITVYSCQKEISFDSGGTIVASGDFTANIEGNAWVANNIKAASRQNGVIVLYGSSTDKKGILLRVADSGVHVYSFRDDSPTNAGVYTDSAVNNNAFATNQWGDAVNHGTLSITQIDTTNKTISGTFSMNVKQQATGLTRTITNGVFNNISYAATGGTVSSTDSFRVKIDGVQFAYDMLYGISAFGNTSVSASMNGGANGTVGITVPDNTPPGSYQLSFFPYIGQYNPNLSVYLVADTGHVDILENNPTTKRIRGNFNFYAKPPFGTGNTPVAQLTEGYFSVKYN